MTGNGPFPPIDPNELGDSICISVDKLLIPYLLGVIDDLTASGLYEGDPEDIIGTVYAFEDLMKRLMTETPCT